ncbi:MAG TPA: hypothetical protein VJZ70_07450 [Limnochordia bacterium]|nr:hypothetical protein [Limnochordia bacterium]
MSEPGKTATDWDFLIGYPLDEAQQILQEEALSYELLFTAAPGKVSSEEDAFIIAVRGGDVGTLVLVCASADWTVGRKG